jgi:uncharacterized membrane protein YhfC
MNPLYLLQGVCMSAVGLFAVLYWKRRNQVPATFFLWGGLSWLIAIVLKSIASAPMPQIMDRLRDLAPPNISEPSLWLFIGLLTGVFECGTTLVMVCRTQRIRSADWRKALAFGLGFGAAEAIILGVYSFVIVLLIIVIPDQLPPELLDLADPSKESIWAIPVPIVERAIVILLHTFSSLLIIFAVQKKEWRWFWGSFLYKTAMDIIAGYFHITYGLQNLTLGGLWLVELFLLPFGLIGIWGINVFQRCWPQRTG